MATFTTFTGASIMSLAGAHRLAPQVPTPKLADKCGGCGANRAKKVGGVIECSYCQRPWLGGPIMEKEQSTPDTSYYTIDEIRAENGLRPLPTPMPGSGESITR